jgi:transcription initiation factor TFIIIB Brf1 subunit/transcription initiation factor TFIIB
MSTAAAMQRSKTANKRADDPFGLIGGLGADSIERAVAALVDRRGGGPELDEGEEFSRCAQCGGAMRRAANNIEFTCGDCGLVLEGDSAEPDEDEGAPRAQLGAARLRIVGPNSGRLQPDLYRSGNGNSSATQKKQMALEFLAYRDYYIGAGGRAFPINACELAAEYYNDVQRACVKRNDNKRVIMATVLKKACCKVGFSPTTEEVAAFMQLRSKGTARGENFVRSLVADGKMEDPDADADPVRPEIATLFARLGFEGERYAGLQDAIYEIVQVAVDSNIGTNSVLRSKVAGATYAVLRRCTDRGLVPKLVTLQEFCAMQHIRKNTIDRFLQRVDDHHSFFEELYRRAGLDAAPTLSRGR